MSEQKYTDVLYRINVQKICKQIDDGIGNTVAEIAQQIVVDFEKKVNKFTIEELYTHALLKGWTTAIIVDETQFEKFIKECLPKWQEEQRNDK